MVVEAGENVLEFFADVLDHFREAVEIDVEGHSELLFVIMEQGIKVKSIFERVDVCDSEAVEEQRADGGAAVVDDDAVSSSPLCQAIERPHLFNNSLLLK